MFTYSAKMVKVDRQIMQPWRQVERRRPIEKVCLVRRRDYNWRFSSEKRQSEDNLGAQIGPAEAIVIELR
jgi:hypothetical protein